VNLDESGAVSVDGADAALDGRGAQAAAGAGRDKRLPDVQHVFDAHAAGRATAVVLEAQPVGEDLVDGGETGSEARAGEPVNRLGEGERARCGLREREIGLRELENQSECGYDSAETQAGRQ
jgi:hypothetical protein